MVWIFQEEISSGMDGFACGAIGAPVSLWSYKLSSFKQNLIAEAPTFCNSH